jgi:sulfoxide reductase catalytic subunit YedY
MLIKRTPAIRSSEITDERDYLRRRDFLKAASAAALAAATAAAPGRPLRAAAAQEPLAPLAPSPFSTDERLNSYEEITSYNNFYEFGLDKEDPRRYADDLTVEPWSVRVEGHINRPAADYTLEDILQPHPLEERIYRLRCVEAWSMVVPWVGFPLGDLVRRFEPTSRARYIRFETLYRPEEFRGQRRRNLDYPYVEGLRMDEALNPLAILAVGLYGKTLLNQNGAPIRLIVPWKYGFKSIKSVTKIEFVEEQPVSTWTELAPREYGFYSNVNPERDHPRWSQRSERRIGERGRRRTEKFNGYGEWVASMYEGMDLIKDY